MADLQIQEIIERMAHFSIETSTLSSYQDPNYLLDENESYE